jgi:hypothetical protein
MKFLSSARAACSLALFVSCLLTGIIVAQNAHTTNEFRGVKVNGGTVTHSKQGRPQHPYCPYRKLDVGKKRMRYRSRGEQATRLADP